MPVASALPSSWVFNSIPSCLCLPLLSTIWSTTSAFLTGLPLASFTTVTFNDAVFSAGTWDFFPAKDATGRSVPHSNARVRRWIFMARSILPLMSPIPGNRHVGLASLLCSGDCRRREERADLSDKTAGKPRYFSHYDRSIHVDVGSGLPYFCDTSLIAR